MSDFQHVIIELQLQNDLTQNSLFAAALCAQIPDDNQIESPDQTIDQPSQDDVVIESVDADVEQFNVEQMRALIQQLENENSALRMNVRFSFSRASTSTIEYFKNA